MRHGEAQPRAPSDALRELTERGEKEVIANAGRMQALVDIEMLISSPYIRARQTAGLVQQQLPQELAITNWQEITPSGDCAVVFDKICAAEMAGILLVTHQPFISKFINYLTGSSVAMGTASVVAIENELLMVGCGEVQWQIHNN
jgi:phosphohistidine phosphatase